MNVACEYNLCSVTTRERTGSSAGLVGVEKRCIRVGYVRERGREIRLAGPVCVCLSAAGSGLGGDRVYPLALSSYWNLAPRAVSMRCSKASTPYACLGQSNALAFGFRGIIEEIQHIRNIFCSGAEVYNRNLEVIVSYVDFIDR